MYAGVYLIHPLVIELCGGLWSNDGNFAHMAVAGVMYFMLSAMACVSGRCVRGVKKII